MRGVNRGILGKKARLVTLAALCAAPSWAGWRVEVTTGLGRVENPVMTIAPDGETRVTYRVSPAGGPGELRHLVRSGSSWGTPVVVDSGSIGEHFDMSVSSDGRHPMISYHDSAGGYLKRASWTGSSWALDVPGAVGRAGFHSSVAIDGNGFGQFAYNVEPGGELRHTIQYGALSQTVDRGVGALYPSIAVDSAGAPRIAYYDSVMGDLKFAWRTPDIGIAFTTATVLRTGDVGRHARLSLLRDGSPQIVHYDATNGATMLSWTLPGDFTTWFSAYLSLVTGPVAALDMEIDANNFVHIVSRVGGNVSHVRYSPRGSSSTVTVANAAESSVSLALDPGGAPRVAYVTQSGDLAYAVQVPQPNAPTVRSSERSTGSIRWLWWDDADDETGYRVRRASDGFDLSGPLPPGATYWDQAGLSPNSRHEVVVEAFNDAGATPSAAFEAFTLANPAASLAVTNVYSTRVALAWDPNGNPPGTLYRVQISTDNAVFTTTASTQAAACLVDSLTAETTYYFRVLARNGDGYLSAPSGSVAAVTTLADASGGPIPPPPFPTTGGFTPPPGLREAYVYPNPAVGSDPVIRAMMGGVEEVEITIYDQSGRAAHTARTSRQVTVDDEPALEYTWTGEKAPGVYYAVIHGKSGGQTVRARAKFAVVK